jgi:hypothetical protein
MAVCALVLLLFVHTRWVQVLAIGCMSGVALWLWLRPEPPPRE